MKNHRSEKVQRSKNHYSFIQEIKQTTYACLCQKSLGNLTATKLDLFTRSKEHGQKRILDNLSTQSAKIIHSLHFRTSVFYSSSFVLQKLNNYIGSIPLINQDHKVTNVS